MELVPSSDTDLLVSLLREADEDPNRIREAVRNPVNSPYLFTLDGQTIGAALVQWQPDESELIYIVISPAYRGRGHGKVAVKRLIEIGRDQGVKHLLVGTANSSMENLAFYQKCGFRMDSVRKDFFDYFPAPVYEHGIQMRDMVMLRYTFE